MGPGPSKQGGGLQGLRGRGTRRLRGRGTTRTQRAGDYKDSEGGALQGLRGRTTRVEALLVEASLGTLQGSKPREGGGT